MKDASPTVIRSLQNATVRRLVRLRDNRTRRRNRLVLTDGWRETSRAIEGGLQICQLYVPDRLYDDAGLDDPTMTKVFDAVDGAQIQPVSDAVMQKISYAGAARGIVGEFQEPATSLESLKLSQQPLILVLDGMEKPGNIGATFRCADAAGVDGMILTGGGTDLFNPNAIRSSLGTIFTVQSAIASDEELVEFLHRHSIRPVAARVESSTELWSCDLTGPLAVILGSESKGLGNRWKTLGNEPIAGVRIPMLGVVDSLNVSVSAALIVYEAARARQTQ